MEEALSRSSFESVDDDQVALISFRAELERMLRALAEKAELDPDQPIPQLLDQLVEKGLLKREGVEGLLELLEIGNKAAHGTPVSAGSVDPIRTQGRALLEGLDEVIRNA